MLLGRFVLILELHWFKERCLGIKLCVLIMPKGLILQRNIDNAPGLNGVPKYEILEKNGKLYVRVPSSGLK